MARCLPLAPARLAYRLQQQPVQGQGVGTVTKSRAQRTTTHNTASAASLSLCLNNLGFRSPNCPYLFEVSVASDNLSRVCVCEAATMSSSLQHHQHHAAGTHVRSSRTSLAHPVRAFAKRGSQHAVARPSRHGAVLQQLVSPSPSTKPGQCPEAQYAQWAQSVAVSTPTVTPTTTTMTPTTTTTSSSSSQQLVQSRVLRDHLCIRHLCQERDLMAVAQLQVRHMPFSQVNHSLLSSPAPA